MTAANGHRRLRMAQPLHSPSADANITNSSRAFVQVDHGIHQGRFLLGGKSVLYAKLQLGAHFNIPYFADAFVNDKLVPVNHVLQDGDLLRFGRRFGFKGARDRPRDKVEAEALLEAYPELGRIAHEIKQEARECDLSTEASIDRMTVRVARYFEAYFGPIPKSVLRTFNELVAKASEGIDRIKPWCRGELPKRPGRPNTTKDIADFADARRRRKREWKEISEEWNKKHPNRPVTYKQVRDDWRRRYGDKSPLSKKLRGKH
jgi:hypothetical protein